MDFKNLTGDVFPKISAWIKYFSPRFNAKGIFCRSLKIGDTETMTLGLQELAPLAYLFTGKEAGGAVGWDVKLVFLHTW